MTCQTWICFSLRCGAILIILKLVVARDPLYSVRREKGHGPQQPGSRTTHRDSTLVAGSSHPWRNYPRTISSYSPTKNYVTRFLSYDEWRRDPRSRLWTANFKTRNIGKLSWTSRIIMTNILVFVAQMVRPAITGWGMKRSDRILAGRELYRLVTPMFLHGSIFHLFTNMVSLQRTGGDLEKLFGPGRFVASYLVAGVAGNYLSAVKSPNPSLGASGAVFGVFGAYFVFLSRNEWLLGSYGQAMTNSIIQTIGMNLVLGAMNPMIDNWGHLGGALGGAAMAYVFGPRLYLTDLPGSGSRAIVDLPVARVPLAIEQGVEKAYNAVSNFVTNLPFTFWFFNRPEQPWRKQSAGYRLNTPNRSIKPRQ